MTKQTASNNPVLKVVKTMVTAADFKEAAKIFNEAEEANRITALVDYLEDTVAMSREELVMALEEVANLDDEASPEELVEPTAAELKAAEKARVQAEKKAAAEAKKAQRETDRRLAAQAKLDAKIAKDAAREAAKEAKAAAKAAKATKPNAKPVAETEDGQPLYPLRVDHVLANVTEGYLAEIDTKAQALGYKNFRDYCRNQLDFMFDKLDDEYANAGK